MLQKKKRKRQKNQVNRGNREDHMILTSIEPYKKTRYKIYLDGEFAFVLYKGELSSYGFKEGDKVEATLVKKIEKEVVLKRAKLRALHLLNDMSRTESELREKLKQNLYSQNVIEEAMEYVKSFGYINDENYVRNYISSKKSSKSRKEIYAVLMRKGISRELAEELLGDYYDEEGEQEAIRALIRKRRYNSATATNEEKQKMYAYLARKGFGYLAIQQALQFSEWNT